MTAEGETAALSDVARYKALLREFIDRRPSGLRGRLARALGKHKSFVTQITSPAYAAPIPAKDLATIMNVCHLSDDERRLLLEAYGEAHPQRAKRARITPHEVTIALPPFRSRATAQSVETLILDFAARVIRLAQEAETATTETPQSDQERTS